MVLLKKNTKKTLNNDDVQSLFFILLSRLRGTYYLHIPICISQSRFLKFVFSNIFDITSINIDRRNRFLMLLGTIMSDLFLNRWVYIETGTKSTILFPFHLNMCASQDARSLM